MVTLNLAVFFAALVFLGAVLAVDAAKLKKTKAPTLVQCYPVGGVTVNQCNNKIKLCPIQEGVIMKWTGTGCKSPSGKALKDGGCQCNNYCGYLCPGVCNADSQCSWNFQKGACIQKITGQVGGPMSRCYNVTARPTTSPTTSKPSISPTTSTPTISPTPGPTTSPTPPTPQPSSHPTTPKPSQNPTTPNPSANPTTSRPTKSPTTSVPTQNPSTSKPSLSPTTRSPTKAAPTTLRPTTKSPTTICGTCTTDQNCVLDTCLTQGLLQITLTWHRKAAVNLWVYPPTQLTYVGPANIGPSTSTAQGKHEITALTNTYGPDNIYWPTGKTPPKGKYKVCAEPGNVTPPVSVANPINVTVTVNRPGVATVTLKGSITVDSYQVENISPECNAVGRDSTNLDYAFGTYIGTFTIS